MKHLWALVLLLAAPLAGANVICAGCEDGDAAGNYLGAFNARTGDLATFQHTDVGPGRRFTDFWVFDVSPSALGSLSADFTLLASIGDFAGALFRDAGSTCAGSDCTSIALGPLLGSVDAFASRWEIVNFFAPGRYVLRISGAPNAFNHGAYTGQASFLAVSIREAGTLGLLGLGLMALGGVVWRRSR